MKNSLLNSVGKLGRMATYSGVNQKEKVDCNKTKYKNCTSHGPGHIAQCVRESLALGVQPETITINSKYCSFVAKIISN